MMMMRDYNTDDDERERERDIHNFPVSSRTSRKHGRRRPRDDARVSILCERKGR